MRRRAPDVPLWLLRLDDASGVEGDWIDAMKPLPVVHPRIVEARRRRLFAVPRRELRGDAARRQGSVR